MNVLVLIPSYNEEAAIEQTFTDLRQIDVDILVINDGSRDRTAEIIRHYQIENSKVSLVSLPLNSGIGAAMQTGFLYAREHNYDYAVQFDGDGQHKAECIAPMLQHAMENSLDLCIGSRFLNLQSFTSSPMRRIGIRFFAGLIGLLSSKKVTDPTSGFRMYGRKAIKRFADHYPDDYPEPEALFWCTRNGLKVGEFSVLMQERQGGQSSIRYLKTIYYMFKVSLAILVDRIRKREI